MTCDECGSTRGPVLLRQRLDPLNLHADRRTLCGPCGTRLGYRPVDFSRGYAPSLGKFVSSRDSRGSL